MKKKKKKVWRRIACCARASNLFAKGKKKKSSRCFSTHYGGKRVELFGLASSENFKKAPCTVFQASPRTTRRLNVRQRHVRRKVHYENTHFVAVPDAAISAGSGPRGKKKGSSPKDKAGVCKILPEIPRGVVVFFFFNHYTAVKKSCIELEFLFLRVRARNVVFTG